MRLLADFSRASAGRATDSWEALREGGPTKSVGAGSRLGFRFEVGDCLVGDVMPGTVVDDMICTCSET